MALRDASEVGVRDIRRFADLQVTDSAQQPAKRAARTRRTPKPKAPPALTAVGDARLRDVDATTEAAAGSIPQLDAQRLLGDEDLVYLQADVAKQVLEQVKSVSYELMEHRPHLARHQIILGGLVWEYVDHTDQRKLDELADLVDAYGTGPWHGLPQNRRLSGRLPASLKRRMHGTILALERSRRDVSAKLLVSALVWRHVIPRTEDEARFARLVDTLGGYAQELGQKSQDAPQAASRSLA